VAIELTTPPNMRTCSFSNSGTDAYAWTDTLNLADQFRLTVYDAAYLELARRKIRPLATLDQELRTAATAIGMTVLGN
jgi:predicted nucleic acid-binding protein